MICLTQTAVLQLGGKSDGLAAVFAVAAVAAPAGGYFVGNSADRRITYLIAP